MDINPEVLSKALERTLDRMAAREAQDPSLIAEPEIVGLTDIPLDVRGTFSVFGIRVVNMLEPGRAVKIRIDNQEQKRVYRSGLFIQNPSYQEL